jgi:heptosyltransferase-2
MKPRLLVVELHHLGDAVMSLPFIRGAQEKFDVHVLCRPSSAAIYAMLAKPPQTHEWEPPWADGRKHGAMAAIRAEHAEGRKLSPIGFDTAVCVWADARAEIVMAETGAKHRIGFPMTRANYYASYLPWRAKRLWAGRLLEKLWTVMRPAEPLLTTRLYRENASQPHLRCWEQMAEALGVSCDYSAPWIKTRLSAQVETLRVEGKPLLAVHTHARLPSKQWPVEKWKELLANSALRERFAVFEILPEAGETRAEGIASVVTPDVSALVSALSASDAVLCHDSLPGHLAAALGKPVVTIFGSGEPDWFAPWRNRDLAVQKRVCPLHPCIDRCGMDSYLCLNAVTVEDVLGEVLKISATR